MRCHVLCLYPAITRRIKDFDDTLARQGPHPDVLAERARAAARERDKARKLAVARAKEDEMRELFGTGERKLTPAQMRVAALTGQRCPALCPAHLLYRRAETQSLRGACLPQSGQRAVRALTAYVPCDDTSIYVMIPVYM
jgi:hypothetical protein